MKKIYIKLTVLSLLLMVTAPKISSAQSYNMAPALGRDVFLLNGMNPGVMMEGSFLVMPILGQLSLDVTLPMTVNRAIIENPDPTASARNLINIRDPKFISSMKNNLTNVDFSLDIANFGIKFRERHMITFSIKARAISDISLPDGAASFLAGNELGKMSSHHLNLGTNTMAFAEAAIGYTIEPMENLTVGIRVKYLAGLMNAYSNSTADLILRDDMTYGVKGDIDMRVTGMSISSTGERKTKIGVNNGFAVDFGAEYAFDFRLRVGASVNDLGMIRWKNGYMTEMRSDPSVEYNFVGVENLNQEGVNVFAELWKDLRNSMNLVPEAGNPYTTMLSPKLNIYGTYGVDEASRHTVSLNMITRFNQPKVVKTDFTATAGYTYSNKNDTFRAIAGYTISSRLGSMLSAGVLTQGSKAQFYFMLDTAPGMFAGAYSGRSVGFRWGLTFFLGCNR